MSCQPVVDTRCDTNQVRYATDRSCVSADYDCSETCGSVGGTINSDLGTCVCSSTTVPQEFDCYTGCIQVKNLLFSLSSKKYFITSKFKNSSQYTVIEIYSSLVKGLENLYTMAIWRFNIYKCLKH